MISKTHLWSLCLFLLLTGFIFAVNDVQAAGVPAIEKQVLESLTPLSPVALPAAGHTCSTPTVSGDRPGIPFLIFPTPHQNAFDGFISSALISSYDNWQYITIDYKCVGTFSRLRRYMTADLNYFAPSGSRTLQGEGVSYSVDGQTWTQLTGSTTTGWQGYVNYRPHAWHTINYGWSEWLTLNTPVRARYVRFHWDGDNDFLNEIEVDFTPDPILEIDRLDCEAGAGRFLCTALYSGANGPVTASWRITSGPAQITSTLSNNTVSTANGTCQNDHLFAIELTVTDPSGHSDTARRSGVKCYELGIP
ncbi:MAG: discoidin domain-containing protein [Ardenticatenaceae bacterium]|nr:discoidin domain-containing protein [Ardenticatenaceae bacterium]